MSSESKFAGGPNRHNKRPKPPTADSSFLARPQIPLTTSGGTAGESATGLFWDSSNIDWDLMVSGTTQRAVAHFKAVLPSHVWDAAALEGNSFTLPEVQTLLDGVTVGGHMQEEADQVQALGESSRALTGMVESGRFSMDCRTINRIHRLVARFEALDAGMFRGEGPTNGGGLVNLGGLGEYRATGSQDGGAELGREFESAIHYLSTQDLHPAERAIAYFGIGAMHQFFFDGNKRTSRLMMNGWLMAQGFDAISIPAARRLELNQHLITMYTVKDATPLMEFILDCRPQP